MFFILGSAFTKFKYSEKEFLGVAQGKGGKRGYKNAFANVGVGVAAAILFGITVNIADIFFFIRCNALSIDFGVLSVCCDISI